MARLGTRVINKRLLESLARAGALDTLEPNRRRVVDGAEVLLRYAAAAADAAQSDQVSLFGGSGAAQVPKPPLPSVEDWPALERLQMEFDVLGLFLSAHPAGRLPQRIAAAGRDHRRSPARRSPARAAGSGVAGVIASKQERVTERTRLVRLIVSDHTAQFEVTAFSELMGQARDLLDGTAPLYFEVDARVDGDNLRLTAQRIQKLDEVVDMARAAVEITLAAPNVALRLRTMLQRQAANGARVRLVVPVPGAEDAILRRCREELRAGERPDGSMSSGCAGSWRCATWPVLN